MSTRKKQAGIIAGVVSGLSALVAGLFTAKKMTTEREEPLASTPRDYSLKTWKKVIEQTIKAMGEKNLGLVAGGVAFFSTLAFFPLIAAIVAIAALTIPPGDLDKAFDAITKFLPHDLASLVTTQLATASGKHTSNVMVAVLGIALSIFSVAGAVQNMMNASNVAYGLSETRSFIATKLTSIALTVGMIIAGIITVPLIFLGGNLLKILGVPEFAIIAFNIVRWPILILIVILGLAIFYRFGPNRTNPPKIQWISWGAIIATIAWTLVTVLFFVYVQYFANFTKSYSLFAGIIVLMTWLNYTSLVFILGAEINHRLESQTLRRTTKLSKFKRR